MMLFLPSGRLRKLIILSKSGIDKNADSSLTNPMARTIIKAKMICIATGALHWAEESLAQNLFIQRLFLNRLSDVLHNKRTKRNPATSNWG